MRVLAKVGLGLLAVLAIAAVALGQTDEAERARRATPVAEFEGGVITVGDLEDQIARQSPLMQRRYTVAENRKLLLEKAVRFELLAKEAQRRGFDKDDLVVQAVKQNAVQTLIRKEFDEKITAESITEAEIKTYYDAHLDEFVRPAMRRASHIRVATEAEAKQLLEETKGLDMRKFRQLARTKSADETTKLRGGDLGYFDAKGTPRDPNAAAPDGVLVKAVFGLKNVGDITPKPLKLHNGFSVAMLTGDRAARERTMQDASDTIRTRLWREKRQAAIDAFLAKLKAELKPELHPELVDHIDFQQEPPVAKGPGVPKDFPVKKTD